MRELFMPRLWPFLALAVVAAGLVAWFTLPTNAPPPPRPPPPSAPAPAVRPAAAAVEAPAPAKKNIERVEVRVMDPSSFGSVSALRRLMESVQGGVVEQRSTSAQEAILDVTYVDACADGLKCAMELALAVKGQKAGKLTVEVVDVGFNKVVLRLNLDE
jgi:hypothetical protein